MSHRKLLECAKAFFILTGEDFLIEEKLEIQKILSQSEVPAFRKKVIHASHSKEGIENLDYEVFLKRHAKYEIDEKRRKRWDIQRMREQRNVERLRARYEANESKSNGKKNEFAPYTLNPEAFEDLKEIEVVDALPVSAFGFQLPFLSEEEHSTFSLSWQPTIKANAMGKKSKNP